MDTAGLQGFREFVAARQVTSAGSQLLSPSGRRAAVVADGARLRILDTRTGAVLATSPTGTRTVFGWRDEDHLVVEGGSGLVLLSLADGTVRPYAAVTGALYGKADVSPVGR